jgi:hypothetical protein
MHKRPVFPMLGAVLAVLFSMAHAQTSGEIGINSIVTGQLAQPGAPTVTQGGISGLASYSYTVAAVDLAGGTTNQSSTTTTNTGNATLSTSNYNIVSTSAVAGAASCNVYRTAGSTPTGYIGNTPCGTSLHDIGTTATLPAPTVNTTGSVSISGNLNTVNATATGSVTAQSFNASGGSNAGTSIWNTGALLASCATNPPPCIPTTGSFFLQASPGISTPYGWTMPTSGNTAAQLVYLSAPSGTPSASTVSYVGVDSTTTHALFATSGAPAFRAISTNDTTPNYYGAATDSANAYTITTISGAANTTGTMVEFTANAINGSSSGASTLNVNGTAKPLTKDGNTPLNLGDIQVGPVYTAIYDGTEWQLINPSSTLGSYSTNQTAAAGTSAVGFSTTSTTATLFGIIVPAPGIITGHVNYETVAKDTSGSNHYDIGLYPGIASFASASPLLHIGKTLGSTFAPNASSWQAAPLAWSVGSVFLPPGRYYLAIISDCASGCATLAGQAATVNFGQGTATTSSAATLTTFTTNTPADGATAITTPTIILLP